jgi:uncharacterized membrane protein YfhO
MHALQSGLPQEYLAPLIGNLTEMRKAMFTADCWRSLFVILLGTVMLFLFMKKKLRADYMVIGILVLCLVDMWSVNKRYLNNEMFVNKSERDAPQAKTNTDEFILQDTSDHRNYRVLNLASNTFNENETSYYHKSIGGYHAAKLRRYQDLIDVYLTKEMHDMMPAIADAAGDMTKVNGDSIFPILNMLNMRYAILPLQGGETVPVKNPYAYGNAWFVDEVQYVENANQEMDALGKLNLRHQAVADQKFKEQLGVAKVQDNTSVVTLTAYEPNHLTYNVQSGKGGVVVFSEIYYPGWTATVDGRPADLGRVDYVLRALQVAPGTHQVELMFYPKSINTTETIAYMAYAVLLIAILLIAYFEWKKSKKVQV